MSTLGRITRYERRQLKWIVQCFRDVEAVRRATAILELNNGSSLSVVAGHGADVRSTVYRWIGWYQSYGMDGLLSMKTQSPQRWLRDDPKFELLSQPTWHPWVNW